MKPELENLSVAIHAALRAELSGAPEEARAVLWSVAERIAEKLDAERAEEECTNNAD